MHDIVAEQFQSPKTRSSYTSFEAYARDNLEELAPLYVSAKKFDNKYIDELFYDYHHVIIKEGVEVLANYSSDFVNIISNHRHTVGNPGSSTNSIRIYGDSRVVGIGVEDAHTLPSCVQKKMNESSLGHRYSVVNRGIGSATPLKLYNNILRETWAQGDILIFFMDLHNGMDDVPYGDMQNLLMLQIIKRLLIFCRERGVFALFLQYPSLGMIISPTCREQNLPLVCFSEDKTIVTIKNYNSGFSKICTLCAAHGIAFTDMTMLFHRPHGHGEVFIDHVHLNHNGHAVMAEYISAMLMNFLSYGGIESMLNEALNMFSEQLYESMSSVLEKQIEAYILSVKEKIGTDISGRNGAIVMNCNPFTNGHLYLIESVSKHVDTLFVFVVEEDRSVFTYEQRFEMVKRGTAHVHNVVVVNSGSFIISSSTLPEYFTKEICVGAAVDATYDLEIFAKHIAPPLNIAMRFVGEEPFCEVTSQYNKQMKSILKKFGIAVVELPRLCQEGVPISATQVRKGMAVQDVKTLEVLLPVSTREILNICNAQSPSCF